VYVVQEREEFALNLSGAGVNLSATLQTPANFDILPINHPNIPAEPYSGDCLYSDFNQIETIGAFK
jgi:hypothetical protein